VAETHGFTEADPKFEAERLRRAELVEAFLAAMSEAGNPGTARTLGSSARELTGQHQDRQWEITLEGDEDAVVVHADGRNGWAHAFVSSDRPVRSDDEISPDQLADALRALLDQNDVPRPEILK
jgi:hypothetical protein